ncbi:hypothetical protein A2Z67_01730 [Candidatus Woesebacteria bacterium RBG_13_36_22]|uniref:HD domain-containing protein n=1 Tax=Candidatus Woesebacteria bacterium RBG_13_36_22 TaxID=1802478 RepID=A0A1F7X330_9BACT|nr:MAG: hypothetical protein A2Z67_01730 [Candidatus Woesebacteria bacterium RBG_13_36_22]
MVERILVEHDRVYGENCLEAPVVVELIASKPIQRLKELNQFGIPDEFYHLQNFSRYEHSVGVMLLLRHLGASEEEQVAGLLHDVSHPAFSHVYDWLVGTSGSEDSQDQGHNDYLRNSEIAGILNAHGYSIERITDYCHFGLLERESPDLCADRIDYSLREFEPDVAKKILTGLTVSEGQIVCRDMVTAAKFGREFLERQRYHWSGRDSVTRYHIFSSVLRKALQKGIIENSDFMVNDGFVVNKLKASNDQEVLTWLDYLRQKPLPITHKGITVRKKFRYIDPLAFQEESLVRLSEADSDFEELLRTARSENEKGIVVQEIK